MQPTKNYDVIVIGAGLGGLSVATSLTQQGYSVLVVEKNAFAGGNCTAFTADQYRFDFALHQLNGVGNDKCLCNLILKEYGVYDSLEFKQVDPFMTIVFPDREYNLSSNWDQLEKDLIEYFPENKNETKKFLRKILTDLQDISVIQRYMYGKNPIIRDIVKDVPLKGKILAPLRVPFLFAQARKTGVEYLEKYLPNKKLWSLITASWPYLGMPPSKVSGIMLGGFIATEHYEKTY